MPLRALIVDDERLARVGVRRQLERMDGVEVVGECADGAEAVRAIRELEPDLVLLDIRMPGMDGFEVVRQVGVDAMPPVIFVTAHDEHALRAFEVDAADYVLKPIEPERFEEALRRAADRLGRDAEAEVAERLRSLLRRLEGLEGRGERLAVEKGGRISFLELAEIRWVEAAGNYARLHAGEGTFLVRRTLKSLEEVLDPGRFLRISRSVIVDMARVEHLTLGEDERYRIHLDDGTRLHSSRRFRPAVRDYIRRHR